MTSPTNHHARLTRSAALLGILFWANRSTLLELIARWSSDPRYSHGFLVPVFALYLLWTRTGRDEAAEAGRAGWRGVALIAAGAAIHLAGARYYVPWVEAAALLPSLAGVAVLTGSRRALRRSWPSIVFLLFMVPLPYRVETALGRPLQRGATVCSTCALQTMGLAATAEGNVITLGRSRIGVVEACNGLGMLFTFMAISTAAALVSRRPPADNAIIALSAVPIAFVANVLRIVATGWLRETAGGRVADMVYHDLAGWLMMPLAMLVLWAETRLLSVLFVEPGSGKRRAAVT